MPVMLSNAASYMQDDGDNNPTNSIWNRPKADDLVIFFQQHHHSQIFCIFGFNLQKVDTKKLEKAEAKLQQKQQIKKEKNLAGNSGIANATASQVMTKKENRMEAKGTNNCKDIRIENFDIAFGEKYIILFIPLFKSFNESRFFSFS